jgi:hypothetical protein
MINGGYTAPTATTPANFKIPFVSVIVTSPTEATIVAGTPPTNPGSYSGVASTAGNFSGFSAIDHRPFTDPDGIVFLTGLLPGTKYYLRVQAYSGAGATGTYGEYVYESFTMPKAATVASPGSSTTTTTTPGTTTTTPGGTTTSPSEEIDVSNRTTTETENLGTSTAFSGNRQLQRSYLKIQNLNKNLNSYALAVKNTGISTTYKKYSFGAGILFASTLNEPTSGG